MPERFKVLAFLTCLFSLGLAHANASSVTVIPSSATLFPGQSLFFNAAVVGRANAGVSWTMSPLVGNMTNGRYTAPSTVNSPQTVVLTAASLADGSITGTAVVSLMPFTAAQVTTSASSAPLSITPSTASLSRGQSTILTALNNGGPAEVSWSLYPNLGSITSGVYIAPDTIPTSQIVTVTAVSNLNPNYTATAQISLLANGQGQAGASVLVYPTSATLSPGQGIFFQASVIGSPQGVSWSVSQDIETINNGYYFAPNVIQFSQTVTLTATSLANPRLAASVLVYLVGNSPAPSTPAPPSPSSPTQSMSMQLSPVTVSLAPQQTAHFTVNTTGGLSTAATWSVVPNMGTISNGMYSAPASIPSPTTVTVVATSMSDPSKNASAAITLQKSSNLPSGVSVLISPSSTSLSAGQTTQFTATVTGTNDTSVLWSVTPTVGSVSSSGQYTAPSSISSQQVLYVTAKSVADPTQIASALVTLVPASVTLAPQSISLAAGESVQFTATATGLSSTAVNWSISPQLGSISNGLYVAPATVSSAQNITVTATSAVNSSVSAQATISLTPSGSTGIAVTPASATLTSSQSQQFSAASSGIGGGGVPAVTWSINPAMGGISASGLYTAPLSISAQQTVTVTATGGGSSATASITLTPTQPPPTTITLPLEVIGPNGKTVAASFTVGSGANLGGSTTLTMQIHGLRFDGQASVQVNGSSWMTIANSTVNFPDLGGSYGGIRGG